MSLLENLVQDENIAGENDIIGGSVHDSGLYPATVTLAYLGESSGGATALHLEFKGEQQQNIRTTIYLTSGTAKGKLTTYQDKNNETQYLPGFLAGQSLCKMTTGKPLNKVDTEEKTIDIYNFTAKSDVPTKVPMITEMMGKKILIGLVKQTVDKQKKGDDGKYHDSGETREENEIDKFFHAESRMTSSEILAKATVAKFVDTWSEKNTGITRDKTKKKTGTKGAPTVKTPGSGGKPTESLFQKPVTAPVPTPAASK